MSWGVLAVQWLAVQQWPGPSGCHGRASGCTWCLNVLLEMCSKGTKAFALEKVILTTTTGMSWFRLTCFLNLVLEFTNTGWIKKELYWVYVAAKVMPAALMAISGGPSWPKVKAAGQPVLLEVSWGERNWDLGMECLVTVISPPQPLDQTPERRLSVWALKTDPKFSHLFGVFFQN